MRVRQCASIEFPKNDFIRYYKLCMLCATYTINLIEALFSMNAFTYAAAQSARVH